MLATLDKIFGDVPVLTEVIVTREALRTATDRNMDKILTESDPQIVINSIKGVMKVPSHIINYVIVIINLARNFNTIHSSYYNRSQNSLTDIIAKKSHSTCNNVCLYQ